MPSCFPLLCGAHVGAEAAVAAEMAAGILGVVVAEVVAAAP